MKYVSAKTLVVGVAGAVAQDATVYSESMKFQSSTGYNGMFAISTAGSITITQQCSLDDSNWYDAVDSDGNALGQVCSALTVTTGKYIQFSPVLSPFIRFKVVEGNVAATVASIKLISQE